MGGGFWAISYQLSAIGESSYDPSFLVIGEAQPRPFKIKS
jgi:hypothetical protein